MEQCQRLARLPPDSIEAQHNLGATTGFAFQRKLELDPASYETYNDLAVIHTLLQNPEEAAMVSIVIVASNDAPHVKDAVATALSQTYCNTEVIVCDDGSTDDTETQLEHFGSKITVIRQVCRGPAAALNTAIQHSHGVYIAPLLAGEAFAPDKIAKQVSRLAGQPDLNMIACGTGFVDEDPNHPAAGFESALAAWGGGRGSEGLDRVPFSAVVFRRSLLDQVGWFEESDPEVDGIAG